MSQTQVELQSKITNAGAIDYACVYRADNSSPVNR